MVLVIHLSVGQVDFLTKFEPWPPMSVIQVVPAVTWCVIVCLAVLRRCRLRVGDDDE